MPRVLAHRLRDEIDWVLLTIVVSISLAGVFNTYSTGRASSQPDLYLTQIYFLVFGGVAAFAFAVIEYHHFERLGYVLYGIGILILILVLIPGIGIEVNNSRRWISFGPLFPRFQPSEIMKVLLVVGIGKYLHHDPRKDGRSLVDLAVPTGMTALAMLLIIKGPDLGTALLCLLVFFAIVMLTRLKAGSMALIGVAGVIASLLAWTYMLHDYQKQRVYAFLNSFLDPEADRLGAGWHTYQAKVAIGSGQLTGKGYTQGTAGPHHFLPEQTTDFPFAIFAEEHGFVGAGALIVLYLALILWCLKIAVGSRDRFGSVVAVGVGSIFFWQVMINLGMVMGILPVVGVTLPLFSAGGSSMLSCLMGVGLLMNISMRRSRI